MEKVLESIKQKVSAMRHLQEMFKKHPDLEELSNKRRKEAYEHATYCQKAMENFA